MEKRHLYSIKNMTYLSLFVVFFLLVIVFAFIFVRNMQNLLYEREQDNIIQQGHIATGILSYSLKNVQDLTRDWSSWDETYDFVLGDNPAYIEDTLTDYPFLLHNFNFVIIKDLEYNDLFVRFYDFQAEEDLPEPAGFTGFLNTTLSSMYQAFDPEHLYSFHEKLGKDGIVFYDNMCYYISTLPVLTSDEESAVVGSFTFGRILNEGEIQRMAISEENYFSIMPAGAPEAQGLQFSEGIAIRSSDESIVLYSEYIDYFGENSVLVKVEKTRDLFQSGSHYINITTVILGSAIILLFVLLVFTINKLVLGPLYALSHDVGQIKSETVAIDDGKFGKSREFARLVAAINTMLMRLKDNKQELEKTNLELSRMAYYDHFTKLPNRFHFTRELSTVITEAMLKNNKVAILSLDIDQLKLINDTMGHHVGDHLITETAERLQNNLPDSYIARIGDDEFALILRHIDDNEAVRKQAEALMEIFQKPFIMQKRDYKIHISIGSSIFPDDAGKLDDLMKNADTAMHKAKRLGGNNYTPFTPLLVDEISQRVFMERRIADGLANDEFTPYFQPKVYAKDKRIFGFEALARWRSKEGLVMPGDFIPVAEETGQIVAISWVILRKACAYNQMLVEAGFDTTVAVNMTSQVLLHKDFFPVLEDVISQTGMDIRRLDIEITESALIKDVESTNLVLEKLCGLGVDISVDDFGTGYSALSYLKKLKVDRIKIDRSFIKDLPLETDSAAIVDAIIAMAKSLELAITSEGVETEEQFNYLKERGCDEIQGYFIKPPVSFEEARGLLEKEAAAKKN